MELILFVLIVGWFAAYRTGMGTYCTITNKTPPWVTAKRERLARHDAQHGSTKAKEYDRQRTASGFFGSLYGDFWEDANQWRDDRRHRVLAEREAKRRQPKDLALPDEVPTVETHAVKDLGWMGPASEAGRHLIADRKCAWGGGGESFCGAGRQGGSPFCSDHTERYAKQFKQLPTLPPAPTLTRADALGYADYHRVAGVLFRSGRCQWGARNASATCPNDRQRDSLFCPAHTTRYVAAFGRDELNILVAHEQDKDDRPPGRPMGVQPPPDQTQSEPAGQIAPDPPVIVAICPTSPTGNHQTETRETTLGTRTGCVHCGMGFGAARLVDEATGWAMCPHLTERRGMCGNPIDPNATNQSDCGQHHEPPPDGRPQLSVVPNPQDAPATRPVEPSNTQGETTVSTPTGGTPVEEVTTVQSAKNYGVNVENAANQDWANSIEAAYSGCASIGLTNDPDVQAAFGELTQAALALGGAGANLQKALVKHETVAEHVSGLGDKAADRTAAYQNQ